MAPLLKSSRPVATLLPGVALKNRGALAPARLLIAEGAAVALASDFNPHHTPTLSMQTVVGLACVQMGMTPAEAIVASTINGAHALGRSARTGSLEPGKDADVLLLNIDDYREISRYFGVNLVYSTIKRGQRIYQEGAIKRAS
jgi:imidazolonepropionase